MLNRLKTMFTRKTNKNLPNLKRVGNVYNVMNRPYTPMRNLSVSAVGNVYNEVNTIGKAYGAAIFLDNDQEYLDQLSECGNNRITLRKVRGNEGMPSGYLLSDQVMRNYYNSLSDSGKASATVIMDAIFVMANGVELQMREYLDIGSGIQQDDVDEVKKWVKDNSSRKKVALFDYDRTLTTIEGGLFFGKDFEGMKQVLLNNKINPGGLTLEGLAEYYAGGPQRLAMLQEMFDVLYKNNVVIYILTNNGACVGNPILFNEVVSVFTRNRPVKYLCAKRYNRHKRIAFQSNADLKDSFCAMAGGKRRKTRKQRKH